MATSASAPSTARDRTFAEAFNKWVQTVGIIVAAAWGAYTFIYKEISVPKSAPINITMNLQLKKVGAGTGKNAFVAVEMRVTATNPSTRRIYLLPSMFKVNAYKVNPAVPIAEDQFNELAATTVNAHDGQYVQRFSWVERPTLLAAGQLFTDSWLNPNEAITRTLIFHVPRQGYDLIDTLTYIPSVTVEGGCGFRYSTEEGSLVGNVCQNDANGLCAPVDKNLRTELLSRIGYQMAHSQAELSLWE